MPSIELKENRDTEAGTPEDRELAALAKALGHPTRVAILRYLSEKGGCICGDIVGQLPFAQATVSQHLKVLKDAGLLQGMIDGPKVCYCPQPQAFERMKVLIEAIQPKGDSPC
jgi:ArsR family transcriptional regulator